ncbi:MAG TPA: HEAT repeat domain-containing protein [Terriglobia bacterium]|jgi:HEAT repeat protein|nr:HEAT repeat domain-containing protein [Terriglobia bacterium]
MRSHISNSKRTTALAFLVALVGCAPHAAWGRQVTGVPTAGSGFTAATESSAPVLAPVLATVAAESAFSPEADPQSDALYKEGTQALDDHHWQTAADKFGELANRHADHADEALYWKAYAQEKLGERAEALATLSTLQKDYPQSRWRRDALALRIQMRPADGGNVQVQDQPDEDLKLLALNSLMNSDPEKAIPILQKFLEGSQPDKLKERALFVLSQNGSPHAREVLGQIARGNSSPELQKKALDDLALFGGKDSRQTLAEIYASSGDLSVKRQILHDFMLSGDRDRLLAAAKSETVPELRIDAIHQLGLLGAMDQLWQLYQQESSVKVKAEILHSLFLGGNSQKLIEVARTERDPELQRDAIHNLGLLGGDQTGDALAAMYSSNMDPETRKTVVDALFIQGNAHALVGIARKENDPGMKKEIVSKLALMNSKESTDYMMEILSH